MEKKGAEQSQNHLENFLIKIDPSDLECTDSVLRLVSRPVNELNINVKNVVSKMINVLNSVNHGRGISAIQIGIPARIIVVNIYRIVGHEIIIINPEILSISGRLITRSEGCMSLPDYKGSLARRNKITVKGFDLNGKEYIISTKGYEANVIQHEMDHLDGILYWDRMPVGIKPQPM